MRGSVDYRAVFRAFPLPCALLTRDMVVVAANDAFLRVLDVNPQELVGHPLLDSLHGLDPADVQPFKDALYAPLFHSRRESLVLRAGWPPVAEQPSDARWRAVNVPMLGVTGEPEALLHCLVPPGYVALPGQDEVMDGQRGPDSLARPGVFYAPAGAAAGAGGEEGAASSAPPATGNECVLVVCQVATRRAELATALRGAGYDVFEVDAEASALRCFASEVPLGLVFIDVPGDTESLVRKAFAAIGDVEVLQAMPQGAELRTSLGAVALPRPYTLGQLLSQVRHMLRNRSQRLLFRQATTAAPPLAGAQEPASASLHILLVEDSADTREAARDLLEMLGHAVTAVGSAEDALQVLEANTDFDVLCTDVSLPAMSGVELAAAVRQHLPQLGIVFASGFGDVDVDAQALGAVVLPKPYTPDSLEAALRMASGR